MARSNVYIDRSSPVSKLPIREISLPDSEPVTEVPVGNVVFDRIIYSNEEFKRLVSREFSELSSEPGDVDVQAFFDEYNRVFFSIPREGDNSHVTIVEASSNYINGYKDPKDQIIRNLEDNINKLELEIFDLRNPQENPLFPNGSILSYQSTPYYMDKGYRRPVDYTPEFWEVLTKVAINRIEVNETILRGIPIGPRLNATNFSEPFIPNQVTEYIGEIITELDPSDAPLNPDRYTNIDDYKVALEKDLREKNAVIQELGGQISSIDSQINSLTALEGIDRSNNVSLITP